MCSKLRQNHLLPVLFSILQNELINFMDWLKEAHIKQSEKEKSLVDLDRLKEHADSYKVSFVLSIL